MSWRDKITVNQLLEFCKTPKNRKQIQEHFKMGNIESYHCMKWMVKALKENLIIEKGKGKTSRGYLFKTRRWTNDELNIIAEMRKKEF